MAFETQHSVSAHCERCRGTEDFNNEGQANRAGWRLMRLQNETRHRLICPLCVKDLGAWFQNGRPPSGEPHNGKPGIAGQKVRQ